MKDIFKKILQKVSFFTTNPDTDWRRMTVVLLIIALGSFAWNVYFYFEVQQQIAESEVVSKSRTSRVGAQNDEIQQVIEKYEKKKTDQASLISNKVYKLEDPSVL